MPEPKVHGTEGRIVPSPRIGEAPAAKEQEPKSDLRHPICKDGPCKEPAPKSPMPPESDLRRPVVICKDKPCACPPGETRGKNGGCVASARVTSDQCQPGEYWNGAGCAFSAHQCPPTEYWNGAFCVSSTECASISARGASLANELRGIKGQMQTACSNDPSGQECIDLTQNYNGATQRYRMLMNEAPVNCRAMLADPLSL